MSFSKRLKQILEKKNISQTKAAKLCGIAQQSMNYIINNELQSSKLALQIAEALDINPEWLICGEGHPDMTLANEVPILLTPSMLEKHIDNSLTPDILKFTVIDTFLGDQAFAYLVKPTELAICADNNTQSNTKKFLVLQDNKIIISNKPNTLSFPIFEWRTRHEDFQ